MDYVDKRLDFLLKISKLQEIIHHNPKAKFSISNY
jgi:hypothetical protein